MDLVPYGAGAWGGVEDGFSGIDKAKCVVGDCLCAFEKEATVRSIYSGGAKRYSITLYKVVFLPVKITGEVMYMI